MHDPLSTQGGGNKGRDEKTKEEDKKITVA